MRPTEKDVRRWWLWAMIVIAVALPIYYFAHTSKQIGKFKDGAAVDTQVYNAYQQYFGDFPHFFSAAQAMHKGEDVYLTVAPGMSRAGYIYPPLIAFLYQPLVGLDISTAARISLAVNILAIGIALYVGAKALSERMGLAKDWGTVLTVGVLVALLSADKMKGELQMLQTNALVNLGLALGLWFLDRRPMLMGAAVGFAMNVKYQAIALVPYLLIRRRWKAVGWMGVFTLLWGFLPGLVVGWGREADYLVRGFSGVLRLVGINAAGGDNNANVEPIRSEFSVSLTSAAARLSEDHGWGISPFVLAGCVGILWVLVGMIIYKTQKAKVLLWPAQKLQSEEPWGGLVGMEWVMVMGSMLVFSPQTNMRHMVMVVLVNLLGVTVAAGTWQRGNKKLSAVAMIGLAVVWMGLHLPFGNRKITTPWGVEFWHGIGGPSWTLLLGMGLLLVPAIWLAQQKKNEKAIGN